MSMIDSRTPRRARAKSKGGTIDWVFWQTGQAGLGLGQLWLGRLHLAQKAEIIADAPVLDPLPMLQANDVQLRLADVLAGGRDAHVRTQMGAVVRDAGRDAVAGGEDVLDVVAVVGERREQHPDDGLDAVGPVLHAWRRSVVLEVGRDEGVGELQVLPIEDIGVHAANDGDVVVLGHAALLPIKYSLDDW